jgi:hypothetical protein
MRRCLRCEARTRAQAPREQQLKGAVRAPPMCR